MVKLNHFVSAVLVATSSISLEADESVKKRTPFNAIGHSVGSEIETKTAVVYFAHGQNLYTALSVRPENIKKLPPRVGLSDFVHAEVFDGRLAWFTESSNEIRPLVLPEGMLPPTKEPPEIFTDLTGKVGIVWKSENLKLVETLPSVIDAVTHFAESQRIAVVFTPHVSPFSVLEILALEGSNKKQMFQLKDPDPWSHICWLDRDRLLLSFQGRVSCDYAIYNIAASSYEVPRQTRVMGTFDSREDSLWCVYSSQPKGDSDREEQVWPKRAENSRKIKR